MYTLKFDAILDALPALIAVLAENGTILHVNDAWAEFATTYGGQRLAGSGVGTNYLTAIEQAALVHVSDAEPVYAGVSAVLSGSAPCFTREYLCELPHEKRGYLLYVAACRRTHDR